MINVTRREYSRSRVTIHAPRLVAGKTGITHVGPELDDRDVDDPWPVEGPSYDSSFDSNVTRSKLRSADPDCSRMLPVSTWTRGLSELTRRGHWFNPSTAHPIYQRGLPTCVESAIPGRLSGGLSAAMLAETKILIPACIASRPAAVPAEPDVCRL